MSQTAKASLGKAHRGRGLRTKNRAGKVWGKTVLDSLRTARSEAGRSENSGGQQAEDTWAPNAGPKTLAEREGDPSPARQVHLRACWRSRGAKLIPSQIPSPGWDKEEVLEGGQGSPGAAQASQPVLAEGREGSEVARGGPLRGGD